MTVRALCEANWALLRTVRRLDSASTGYGRSRCLGLAEFAHNSATWGALVDQRLQLSSRIRCSGLLSPEAADFVLELADAGSGLSDAGSGLFGAGFGLFGAG